MNETNLHVANGDAVVPDISNDLVLDLLPALHRLLNQHLRTGRKSLVAKLKQLLVVLCEPGSKSSKSERSSNNDGVADRVGRNERLLEVGSRCRGSALLADLLHRSSEELSVLGRDDRVDLGSEHLAAESLKLVLERNSDRQGRLTSERAVDSVRFLVLDDLSDKLGVDGQVVDLVGETLGRLDGRNVGVDEDGVDALLLESLDGLRTRVVKLSSLTDRETSRTENENLLNLNLGVSSGVLDDVSAGHDEGDELLGGGAVRHRLDEHVKEELGVLRSRGRLGVELDGEVRKTISASPDTLVRSVVGVDEELGPVALER